MNSKNIFFIAAKNSLLFTQTTFFVCQLIFRSFLLNPAAASLGRQIPAIHSSPFTLSHCFNIGSISLLSPSLPTYCFLFLSLLSLPLYTSLSLPSFLYLSITLSFPVCLSLYFFYCISFSPFLLCISFSLSFSSMFNLHISLSLSFLYIFLLSPFFFSLLFYIQLFSFSISTFLLKKEKQNVAFFHLK